MKKIEYYTIANLTRDWNIDMDYHPSLKELWDIHRRVKVWFTEAEWTEYQKMKWLMKSNYLRNKALEMIQIETKRRTEDITLGEYWYEGNF